MGGEEHIPVHCFTSTGKPFSLPVGIPLQLEIGDVSVKMNSMSIGYVGDKCLIVKYPNTGGFGSISNKLFKGNKITVRYVNDGSVIGFQSDLLGVAVDPVRVLFLDYPKAIARHSLRAAKRIGCCLPADLVIDHMKSEDFIPETFRGGIVEDISELGCSYRMIRDFPNVPFPTVEVGDAVTLCLQLPGTDDEVWLPGDVRRIERGARKMGVGIKFREVSEDKKKGIRDYISTVERFLSD
jgi:hypothetical protein